jgi:hypothetical protein
LDAERHFNRVKGYRHLKQLVDALQHDLDGPTLKHFHVGSSAL